MDVHQLRLASSLVATWQYARIYQAPVSKKYANLCSLHIVRLSTVLSVASLIGAFVSAPGAAGEWATKEEAIALVKRTRPLSGVKRTSHFATHMSAIDPKRTCPLRTHAHGSYPQK